MINSIFLWLDNNSNNPKGKLINQLTPIIVCLILFAAFMGISYLIITFLINPTLNDDIEIVLHPRDITVGFFLYFVTAVDYALIIGRMQGSNPGSKPRFVMNVATCVGCFVGVTLVLFLWGFAKEVPWLIIPLLIFAGSVMIKLAYEGIEYFSDAQSIPFLIRKGTEVILRILFYPARVFTFWIPELGNPKVQKMSLWDLGKWSFFLPFIIGTDDLVGYMGAMTIYNVFGLLFGIYLADILIDILIFVAPSFTKKMVQSAILSLLAVYAFIYLAFKSITESYHLIESSYHIELVQILMTFIVFLVLILIIDLILLKLGKKAW